ncbi:SDR family oxidoreductase [Peribacillus psychrosaccharolyticus]|uniref:SDR family NAD(P)-dependent oxidoreductase n=1 Tax=Peribacillus psychrosaccharolyticus TaxID=1407 RepID=UPI003D294277
MQLKGKRIIVTGGASGIGAGTVRAYVREGAIVSALDIADDLGQKVVDEANSIGTGKATYYHCNIADAEEVFSVFEQAAKEMGGLDVLAHVAGIESLKPAEDYTPADLNFVWGVNINGAIYTNQAACKIMKEQEGEGAIINFSSDVALAGQPNGALYATAKGAVLSWTRTIAYEWAMKYNIRCNCVNPTMKTPMYQEYLDNLEEAERAKFLAAEKMKVPMRGEMGDVDRDMAPVMVFLASDASGYINGQIIAVNGGRNMLRG